jgi:hypothetical protein
VTPWRGVTFSVHPTTCLEGIKGEYRYSPTLSLTSALDGCGWSSTHSGRFIPGKETSFPSYRSLGGVQGRSGLVRKTSHRTGIRSPDRPARSESLYLLRYPNPPWGKLGTYVLVMLYTGVGKVTDLSHRLLHTSCSSPTRKFRAVP